MTWWYGKNAFQCPNLERIIWFLMAGFLSAESYFALCSWRALNISTCHSSNWLNFCNFLATFVTKDSMKIIYWKKIDIYECRDVRNLFTYSKQHKKNHFSKVTRFWSQQPSFQLPSAVFICSIYISESEREDVEEKTPATLEWEEKREGKK